MAHPPAGCGTSVCRSWRWHRNRTRRRPRPLAWSCRALRAAYGRPWHKHPASCSHRWRSRSNRSRCRLSRPLSRRHKGPRGFGGTGSRRHPGSRNCRWRSTSNHSRWQPSRSCSQSAGHQALPPPRQLARRNRDATWPCESADQRPKPAADACRHAMNPQKSTVPASLKDPRPSMFLHFSRKPATVSSVPGPCFTAGSRLAALGDRGRPSPTGRSFLGDLPATTRATLGSRQRFGRRCGHRGGGTRHWGHASTSSLASLRP